MQQPKGIERAYWAELPADRRPYISVLLAWALLAFQPNNACFNPSRGLPSCKSPVCSARGQHEGRFHSVLELQVHVFPSTCIPLREYFPALYWHSAEAQCYRVTVVVPADRVELHSYYCNACNACKQKKFVAMKALFLAASPLLLPQLTSLTT